MIPWRNVVNRGILLHDGNTVEDKTDSVGRRHCSNMSLILFYESEI